MQLLPAIDLREGRVVRLARGEDSARTEYDVAPEAVLEDYAAAGVERVHVVDLDAAFGEAPQRDLLRRLLERAGSLGLELQVGGGLRDDATLRRALDDGFGRIVVTSILTRAPDTVAAVARDHPGRLVPALDTRDGELRTKGWTEASEVSLEVICAQLRELPIGPVLVTDIERDGTLEGPNLELACRLGRACETRALLSGGVSSLDDLRRARERSEIEGAIVGKALYDGAIELGDALDVCAGRAAGAASGEDEPADRERKEART